MNEFEKENDPGRRRLLQALAAGTLGAAVTLPSVAEEDRPLLGRRPRKMAAGRSIYSLRGEVLVDKQQATRDTIITPGALVETGDTSRVVFVVGKDSFLLRSNSQLQLKEQTSDSGGVIRVLRLLGGKFLSVFGSPRHRISTPLMTLGIRGTGVYIEAEPDFNYICTCYGETDIQAVNDPGSQETIKTEHHDDPRYVLAEGNSGKLIKPAPFKNHTDEELALIEALVGRTPPFSIPGSYGGPRRDY